MDASITHAHMLMSIPEAASELCISRSTLWRLVNDGRLPVVSIGRRTLLRRTDIESFVGELSHPKSTPANSCGIEER
jgi:excisionase family DNA binding protein